MRKIISIVLLILIIQTSVLVCGCSDNSSVSDSKSDAVAQVDYSNDMQIMYRVTGRSYITKSDDGYYYIGDDEIIIYIDKNTKKATPLCSKPNCTHTDMDTCDAYINMIENQLSAIQYNNGYLYAVCGEYDQSYIKYNTYLMRMNTDGSQRENITGYFDFYPLEWFIHRGYFYCSTDSAIFRIPLDSPKSEPEVLFETECYIESTYRSVQKLYAYENYLYFYACEKNDNDEGPGTSYNCINLDTLEIKALPKINDNLLSYHFFLDDTLIASYYDEEADENIFLKCDFEGNVKEEFFIKDHSDILTYSTDGKYIYADNGVGVIIDKSEQQIIKVYDLNMNEIDSYVPPKVKAAAHTWLSPQDNEYLIFESVNNDGERILVMADKSQIGSLNGEPIEYTELCKLDWAEKEYNWVTLD